MRSIVVVLGAFVIAAALFVGGASPAARGGGHTVRARLAAPSASVPDAPANGLSGEPEINGPVASDQRPATGSELPPPDPAAPKPVSPRGRVGRYATEFWGSDSVMSDTGLLVITSTAPGTFALTGTEIADDSGLPVAGAVVTLTRACASAGCVPLSVRTAADAKGAYAFIDMPPNVPPASYTLTISSDGFGVTRVVHLSFDANETAVESFALERGVRVYDGGPLPPSEHGLEPDR